MYSEMLGQPGQREFVNTIGMRLEYYEVMSNYVQSTPKSRYVP
jgi:hypothetical protein